MKPHFKFRGGVWTVIAPDGSGVLVDKNLRLLHFRWTVINNVHLSYFNKVME